MNCCAQCIVEENELIQYIVVISGSRIHVFDVPFFVIV